MASPPASYDIVGARYRETTQLRAQEDLRLAQLAEKERARLEELRLQTTKPANLVKLEKEIEDTKVAAAAGLNELKAKHARERKSITLRQQKEIAKNEKEANDKLNQLSNQAQTARLASDAEYEEEKRISEKNLKASEESLRSKRELEDEEIKNSLFDMLQARYNPNKAAVPSTPGGILSTPPSTLPALSRPLFWDLPRMPPKPEQQTTKRGNMKLDQNDSDDSETPLMDTARRQASGTANPTPAKKQKMIETPKFNVASQSLRGTPASNPSPTAQSSPGDDTIAVLPRIEPESPPTFQLAAISCYTARGKLSKRQSDFPEKLHLRLDNHRFRPYTEEWGWIQNHPEWIITPGRVWKVLYNPVNLVMHVSRGATSFAGKALQVAFADKTALDGFLACYGSRWPANALEEDRSLILPPMQ